MRKKGKRRRKEWQDGRKTRGKTGRHRAKGKEGRDEGDEAGRDEGRER